MYVSACSASLPSLVNLLTVSMVQLTCHLSEDHNASLPHVNEINCKEFPVNWGRKALSNSMY